MRVGIYQWHVAKIVRHDDLAIRFVPMSNVTRILVLRFSSIGDIVLTTPVLRALKTQLDGEVEIHFYTKQKFAHILEANPHVSYVHVMERTVQEALPDLLQIGFDYIIDLHNNIRSSVVKRRLKCLAFTFKKYNVEKWLWVNLGINRMPNVHIVDRYMDTLKAFGVKDDGKGLDYFIPQDTPYPILPEGFEDGFIAVSVGAMHVGKTPGLSTLRLICQNKNRKILLLGSGKDDFARADQIEKEFGGHVYNGVNVFSLHQSAQLLRDARLVITGDSGLMHMASAFGQKIISLWGCTVPGFGMYPYRPHPESVMIEPHGRKKRPCSKLGNRCKYGKDNLCIDHLSSEEITNAIEKLWALQTKP